MTISLTIDNCDRLPDGGPARYQASQRGFEIGRENRDWTLPDPNMIISGRHCEVRYEQGGYWLTDFSRNGTYVNGASQRVKSPYRLMDGDRIQIGHYLISVSVSDGERAGDAPLPASDFDNIWDTGQPAAPPINRRDLMPAQNRGRRAPDFSEQYLDLPPARPDPGFGAEPARTPSPQADPYASPFGRPQPGGPPINPLPPLRPAEGFAPRPQGNQPYPFEGESFAARPAAPARQPREAEALRQAPPPRLPDPSPAVPSLQGGEAILRAIASGAGVSADVFLQRDASDVAAEIGAVLRGVVEELANLLKARAAAKVLAKSGNRTMIGAVDNNPLKFVPRPEEVLEIMFARRRAGYLDARRSIDEAFRDLKAHEFATYAAMQKALSRLLDDLSPESIEKKASAGAFASKRGRAWDTFVATWEAKSEQHENGMLDVFLSYFADAYEKASKPR